MSNQETEETMPLIEVEKCEVEKIQPQDVLEVNELELPLYLTKRDSENFYFLASPMEYVRVDASNLASVTTQKLYSNPTGVFKRFIKSLHYGTDDFVQIRPGEFALALQKTVTDLAEQANLKTLEIDIVEGDGS